MELILGSSVKDSTTYGMVWLPHWAANGKRLFLDAMHFRLVMIKNNDDDDGDDDDDDDDGDDDDGDGGPFR